MEWFQQFLINNFLLLCIALVLVGNAIVRYKQHARISLYTILLMANTLLIAIVVLLNNYCKSQNYVLAATIFTVLGYCLRPICIFFIIMMTGRVSSKGKYFFLYYLPLIINALVYVFAFIPATKAAVVYYTPSEEGLNFHGGIARYSSHIISGLYLLFLLYFSFTQINSKHIGHGVTILSCSLFVVLAVVIESFFNPKGDIELLNNTIAVSALVYYLYLYIERIQIDTLTGLFNRETYYHDVEKMDRSITGVIQFDMNGLKYINDNYGHLEGDRALSTIASVISKAAKRNMYVYRLGGDEYIILCHNGTEEDIIETVTRFKELISKTEYHCSYGYSYRSKNKEVTVTDLLKEAEKKMYEDKERFYKNSSFERRVAEKA